MIGVAVSFIVGAGCRFFDIPVPSPPVIPGALLVLAMTIGYSACNKFLNGKGEFASTSHLCGGPTGASVMNAEQQRMKWRRDNERLDAKPDFSVCPGDGLAKSPQG
jgi:XapX domain-containing protein